MEKICSRCKKSKNEESFRFKNKEKTKRNSACNDCMKIYRKEHYERKKKYYIEKSSKRNNNLREENRIKIINFLKNNSCVDCGENNLLVLEFDHRERESKVNSIMSMLSSSWSTIKKEIIKCDVRCANCHSIKTAIENNSFKLKYSKYGCSSEAEH